MATEFKPLSEINHGYDMNGVTFGLTLPDYAPSEAIKLNVDKIRSLAKWGGMRHTLVTNYSGDTTTYTPEVNGIDDHGTATGGLKGSSHQAETREVQVRRDDDDELTSPSYIWGEARLSINQEELEDSILHAKKSVREPAEWAKRINKALKSGLREAGHQQLITPSVNKSYFLVSTGIATAAGLAFSAFTPSMAVSLAVWQVGQHISAQMADSVIQKARGRGVEQRRLSMINGLQVDRYAALQVLSRTAKLAKAA